MQNMQQNWCGSQPPGLIGNIKTRYYIMSQQSLTRKIFASPEDDLSFIDMLFGVVATNLAFIIYMLAVYAIGAFITFITKGASAVSFGSTQDPIVGFLYIPNCIIFIYVCIRSLKLIAARLRTNGYEKCFRTALVFIIALGVFLQFNSILSTVITAIIVLLIGKRLVVDNPDLEF